MIQIDYLSFAYGGRRPAVFSDFALTLESGGIYGLLGKNGTGKSTLLYLIAGLLRPGRGSVRFLGQETRSRRPELLEELYLLPEEFTLPPVPTTSPSCPWASARRPSSASHWPRTRACC